MSGVEYTPRLMSGTDLDSAYELCVSVAFTTTREDLQRWWGVYGSNGGFWGAYLHGNDQLIGMVLGVFEDEILGVIGEVVVDSRFRRQGIARALLTRALETLKGRVACLDSRPKVMSIYEKFGFQKLGVSVYAVSLAEPSTWSLSTDRNVEGIHDISAENVEEVLAYDSLIRPSGNPRLLVRLESLEKKNVGKLLKVDGVVVGFSVFQMCSNTLTCYADTKSDATRVLKAVLLEVKDRGVTSRVTMMCVGQNLAAVQNVLGDIGVSHETPVYKFEKMATGRVDGIQWSKVYGLLNVSIVVV